MKNNIVNKNISIKQALAVIDSLAGITLFVVDGSNKMIGTVSDGDIRRGIIKGIDII